MPRGGLQVCPLMITLHENMNVPPGKPNTYEYNIKWLASYDNTKDDINI